MEKFFVNTNQNFKKLIDYRKKAQYSKFYDEE
jgi:hypothetical protein